MWLQNLLNQPEHIRRALIPQIVTIIDNSIQSIDNRMASEALPLPPRSAQNAPIQVVIPTLPATTYKEQSEKEFERSFAYVHVQCKILKSLEDRIALTPRTAYFWTSEIVPKDRWPEPLQALRLCYYMRSLGCDTYAHISTTPLDNGCKTTRLLLLIADPYSEQRGPGYDYVYWAQDIRTGAAVIRAYKARPQNAQDGSSVSRPVLTLDTGSSFNANVVVQQVGQPQNGSVHMRGGEAAERHRYSLTSRELEELGADWQGDLQQQTQWEANIAVEARARRQVVDRTPHRVSAFPSAMYMRSDITHVLVQEADRHVEYDAYRYVPAEDVMSAVDARDTWSTTEAGLYWPETNRLRGRNDMLNNSSRRGFSRPRRNSL